MVDTVDTVDISFEENKAIHTQLTIKYINVNEDVLDIIKSFISYDKKIYYQKKLQKIFKKLLINSINNIGKYYYYSQIYYEDNNEYNHLAVWYVTQNKGRHEFQLQSSTCMKCGKYTEVSSITLFNTILNNRNISCVNWEH